MGSDIASDNTSFKTKKSKGRSGGVDIMMSQGRYETEIFSRTFGIDREKMLEAGLPRNDILAHYTDEYRRVIRKKLGIPDDKNMILYCPTFREYTKGADMGVIMAPPMTLEKWEKHLKNHYVLFIRAHYEVSKVMSIVDNEFTRNATNYPDLNDLIIASDILISDYSSIFFDYSITGKPMLHFTYDYDEYASKRGMYFDIRQYLSGAANEDDLLKLIETLEGQTEVDKSVKFRDKFVDFYGGAVFGAINCIAERLGIQ